MIRKEVYAMEAQAVLPALADDLFLSEIHLAGTHDSATAFCNLRRIAQCQALSVAQQLRAGVRLLDLRLVLKGGRFFLVHSRADCFTDETRTRRLLFGDVLAPCLQFLEAHPRETLVLSVKSDRGKEPADFFPVFYERFIRPDPGRWFLENRVPRLAECRGKLVLLRRCGRPQSFETREKCGLDFSNWPDQGARRRTEPVHIRLSERTSADIQDRYRLPPAVKWLRAAKPFLDCAAPGENRICLHFLSTCGRPRIPARTAAPVNAAFAAYPLRTDRAQGWFLLDFMDGALCEKIMLSNLRLYPVQTPEVSP